MIIYAKGWDEDTKRAPYYHPFIIDTRDVLYVRGCDKDGNRCIVYLKHNVTEVLENSEVTYPLWIGLNMTVKEMMEKLKESHKTEVT